MVTQSQKKVRQFISIIDMRAERIVFNRHNLRTVRRQRRISQNDLAKRAGLGRSTIIELESGENKNPGLLALIEIGKVLNVIWILDWQEIEKPSAETEGDNLK
jgi:transcriptional regulator with XRE-family HTH domain